MELPTFFGMAVPFFAKGDLHKIQARASSRRTSFLASAFLS
jgi:hypothetical protein